MPPRALASILWLAAACGPGGPGVEDRPPRGLIPLPTTVEEVEGPPWRLTADTRIAVEGDLGSEARLLATVLRRATGFPLPIVRDPPAPGDLALTLDPDLADLGPEGYRLEVGPADARIRAPAAAGVFYGGQTLRQLLPPEVEAAEPATDVDWAVDPLVVEDRPRFAWRGTMLDVARHFFTVEEVEGLIEVAAHYKLNRYHLHLTDDQGWRIEIRSWPDLAVVGGATEVGGGEGGWYTQEAYASLVAFAAERHVTLIPEIDMPGHCNAALSAYGELNPDGEPAEPYTGVDVGFSALWLDGPATSGFVRDVLGEVAALTPGPWLHVGGDEAHATPVEDYAAFMEEVQGIVAGLGRTMVAWDEVAAAPISAPVLAQSWRDPEHARAAADRGATVIASPADHAYLDMVYDLESPVGAYWAGPTSVEDAYAWDPVLEGLDESEIAGVEAPLWTESVAEIDEVEFLVYPRLLGHADLAWSDGAGDWDAYRARLAAHGPRMEAWGLAFHPSPEVDWETSD